MSGWLVVLMIWLGLTASFALGCWWAGRKTIELKGMIVALKAAQDHRYCTEMFGRLIAERDATFAYARTLEDRLDGRDDLDAELRQLSDGGGTT